MNLWKIAAAAWLGVEVWLSHTPGEKSGEESHWLARTTGIKEGILRRVAHVVLFLVLAVLVLFAFPEADVGLKVGVVSLWAILDEVTKRWIPGRHSSTFDMLLNLIGVGIGLVLWLIT